MNPDSQLALEAAQGLAEAIKQLTVTTGALTTVLIAKGVLTEREVEEAMELVGRHLERALKEHKG